MFKGMVTKVLSESLVQVIVGFGIPSAEQFKVNSAGAFMVWLLEVIMLVGETTKSNKRFYTWKKSCYSTCIFTSSIWRVKCLPHSPVMQGIWVRFPTGVLKLILIIQVGKFRNNILRQSVAKVWHLSHTVHLWWQKLEYLGYFGLMSTTLLFTRESRGHVLTTTKEHFIQRTKMLRAANG